MFEAQIIKKENEKVFNDIIQNSINGTYMHNIGYAKTKSIIGREIETYVYMDEGQIIGGAHYSVKRAGKGIMNVADVQGGFLFKVDPNATMVGNVVDHFLKWAKTKNIAYVRISPWMPSRIEGEESKYSDIFTCVMEDMGFDAISQERHTYWIDITKDEETILSQMKRQTRYEVRKSLNSNLVVDVVNVPSDESFEIFWNLYSHLGKKKGFNILNKEQFKYEYTTLLNEEIGHLFLIKCDGVIVNASLSSSLNRAAYLYGAMNPDFKTMKNCSSPGQLAQWAMMMYSKSKGIETYDMGFCPGAIPYKEHPEYHIWRFKHAFGGAHVQFLPVYGKSLKKIAGKIFKALKG
ncbi:MAG: hypothetical protein C0594_06710 [Marinilabiliales bacterium]|nr:MAG: hypothetical protein C0594_06710 [Marinilabiliales bacterium]